MLGGLIPLPEHEIDKIIDRVLTHERVEMIARRVAELMQQQAKEEV